MFTDTAPSARSLSFEVLCATDQISIADLAEGSNVDGVSVRLGDRIAIFGRGDGSDGVYIIGPTASRAPEFDSQAELELRPVLQVHQGTVNGGKVFAIDAASFPTVTLTELTFATAMTPQNSGAFTKTPPTPRAAAEIRQAGRPAARSDVAGTAALSNVGATHARTNE